MQYTRYVITRVPEEDETILDEMTDSAPVYYGGAGLWADADALRAYYENILPAQFDLTAKDFVSWDEIDQEDQEELGRLLAPHICGLNPPEQKISTDSVEHLLIEY